MQALRNSKLAEIISESLPKCFTSWLLANIMLFTKRVHRDDHVPRVVGLADGLAGVGLSAWGPNVVILPAQAQAEFEPRASNKHTINNPSTTVTHTQRQAFKLSGG